MRSIPPVACCLALLGAPRPAWSTQAPRLEPGARVRLDAPSLGGRLTGTLVRLAADTLVVEVDGHSVGLGLIVAADSVTRIDVYREQRMPLEGMVVGALAGTLLAAVASPDWVDENGDCTPLACLAYKVSPDLDTRVAVLGFTGALLGTIVGAETKTAKWAPVHLERLQIGSAPDGGLALGVRISF
jgi:hypothetical protein